MINFFKKPIGIIVIFILIASGISGWAYFDKQQKPKYDFIIAEKHDLVQEVSVTGKVKPAKKVELGFEKNGKIAEINVKVGDEVIVNQLLINLDDAELKTQLAQVKASAESAKADLKSLQANLDNTKIQLQQAGVALKIEQVKLDELKKGTRYEEIKITETKVANAKKTLADAEKNLENIKNKAEVELRENYDNALTTVQKSATIGKNALLTLTDIQYVHFSGFDQDSILLSDAKAIAMQALLGAQDAGRWPTQFISESQLNGGAIGIVQKATNNSINENIDQALIETIKALQKIKSALDIIPITSSLTTTEKTNLIVEKNNVSAEIITLSNKQQLIAVQKITNITNINSAEANVIAAQNALANAEDELVLKKAGYLPEQITSQEAKVKQAEGNINLQKIQIKQAEANVDSQKAKIRQAEANVLNIQTQLAKTSLYSPIDGIVTKQEAEIGEIVSANSSIISIISEKQFEIETNTPEVDMAKIKIGNSAKITLDAFGNNIVFEAKVIAIDPAETMVEGVATYKTTLQFTKKDNDIKSGMTANIDIIGSKREGVIALPQRAISARNGDKIVRILNAGGEVNEIKIVTGFCGSDGYVEIIEGVGEGDRILWSKI